MKRIKMSYKIHNFETFFVRIDAEIIYFLTSNTFWFTVWVNPLLKQ